MTLQEIISTYNERKHVYESTQKAIKDKIARLQKKLEKHAKTYPYMVQEVLVPLAKEIKSRCGFKAYEFYGPFGIENEISIYFSNNGVDGDIKICEVETWCLELRPHYGEHDLDGFTYWNGETVNRFAPGTIGELNGLNKVYVQLPNDIDEIIKSLRHSVK